MTGDPGHTVPPWPQPRRSFALFGTVAAMLSVGAASGAYMLWHRPLPPDPDGGLRCTRAFAARLNAARGGSDADLLALADDALAAGCGHQAFEAADLVGGAASEQAAWIMARVFDPGETDPVFRRAGPPRPAQAAALYAAWASASPRMAEALKRLCGPGGAVPGADPAPKRSCGPFDRSDRR